MDFNIYCNCNIGRRKTQEARRRAKRTLAWALEEEKRQATIVCVPCVEEEEEEEEEEKRQKSDDGLCRSAL
jgi:hypothetical protein